MSASPFILEVSVEAEIWEAVADFQVENLERLARRAIEVAYQQALDTHTIILEAVLPQKGQKRHKKQQKTLQKLTKKPHEVSLIFTDNAHIQALNKTWRGFDKPTNVLSFEAEGEGQNLSAALYNDPNFTPVLGDIVLAFETIQLEAEEEHKTFEHHLIHLIIHGALHLMGYDHEEEFEAEQMEAVEIAALATLGIANPY
jgi:probable rRNA maturation factor